MRRFAQPRPPRFLRSLLLFLLPLAAWASDGNPAPISVTEGGSRVVAVSAGLYHSCALKVDGTLDCWGNNVDGQAAGQPGPYLSVSAGWYHSCGVKADGAVDCWGDSGFGQATDQLGPYLSVSAGLYHSCGVKADGAVDCWGDNSFGRAEDQPGPYLSVSAGVYHSCGVKADGAVDCWGYNGSGQATDQPGPYLSVSAGYSYSCGVKADGAVDCWGNNGFGQAADQPGPYLSVSAGRYHSCGVKADGAVDCWGDNRYGQAEDQPGPYQSVSAGNWHSCGVKADGAVKCWGAGGPGSSGAPHYGQSTAPAEQQAAGATAFGQIAAGNAHACQVRRDGTLACWGLNDEGQADAPAGLFTQVVAGDSHSCGIRANGQLACWGRNALANLATVNSYGTTVWRQLAPGPDGAICGLLADDDMWWCIRDESETAGFGNGDRNITHDLDDDYGNPNACSVSLWNDSDGFCWVGFDADHGWGNFAGNFQRLESGLNHQCGLKLDGSIECWGEADNDPFVGMEEQSGDVTRYTLDGPFRAFSVGWHHACAIRDNGTLACWGSNVNGQATPPAGTFVQVAAGNTFTCAIRSNGTRVCWGSNNHGQAPQLALSPASIADGQVNTAHAGATFALTEDDYLPDSPAYAVVAGSLPPGLSLSAAGVLSGTPSAGGTFTFTVEGEDANGFTASREYTVTIIADSTPPQIGYTLTPAAPDGSNGWYVSDIGIDWTVSDAESSVSGIIGCVDETLNTDTTGTTRSCTASSLGGSASLTTEVLKRDATAPTITATESSTPDGNNGWYRSNATVHFTCNDNLSGVASCPADQVLSSDGSAVSSAAQTAQDVAGNTSAASNVVTVKIDQTAPTLNPTTPSPLLRGQSYVGSPNASDATSGIASSSCGALDTSSLGNKSTSCSATDNAGNGSTVPLHYTVTTTCANDGYGSTQLQWCVQICESGLTGKPLEDWIKRWFTRYRNYPYCVAP